MPAFNIVTPSTAVTVLRFFLYAALTLNLGATVSAVLLLIAVTELPTTSRKMYMSCEHRFPRIVFSYYRTGSNSSSPSNPPPSFPDSIRSTNTSSNPENIPTMQTLNRLLLKGGVERRLLHEFGITRGWAFLLCHCLVCFFGGLICSFVHICVDAWVNQSQVLATILMPISFLAFVPPFIVYIVAWDAPECKLCRKHR